jgi:hypothetical protein
MWLKKVDVAYVIRSCDRPKKESFDGLHKQLKNDFGIKISFLGNFDGWHNQVMWLEKVGVAYVIRSCDRPKKESFDGLHKRLKNAFGGVFPKKEIPF